MSATTYWNFLALFCVLCQGIIGTHSEKDIDESSELLVRQKRVINRTPGGDKKELIKDAPYVVCVKETRRDKYCVGVILTRKIVLTAAKCVMAETPILKVYSGNAQAVRTGGNNAAVHNVTEKRIHFHNNQFRSADGIALATVTPQFYYSINTRNIQFYEGNVHPGLHGVVSGWGCDSMENPGTAYPGYLRTITVPIISNNVCREMYLHTFPITEDDICTLDATGHQYCAVDDAGAPLVIEMNYERFLLGIHLWNGGVIGRANPDVFVNLQHPRYRHWIMETIPIMEVRAH